VAAGSQPAVNVEVPALGWIAPQNTPIEQKSEVGGAGSRVDRRCTFEVDERKFLSVAAEAFTTLGFYVVLACLVVGVAYGSPVRKVEEILLEVVWEHVRTVTPPDPVVLFNDFGDGALVFQTLFWIEMNRPMDQRRVLSDLRFRLDDRFREAGIVIAFPQRDLHVDSLRPIQVQLVGQPVDWGCPDESAKWKIIGATH